VAFREYFLQKRGIWEYVQGGCIKIFGNYPADYPGTFSAENFACFDKKSPPPGNENANFDKMGKIFSPHVLLGNQLDNSQIFRVNIWHTICDMSQSLQVIRHIP